MTSKSYLVFIISSPICILTHTKYAMFVHVVKEYISFYSRVMAFRELTSYVSLNLIMLCIPYGRLICLSTCQHNYLFMTYNIIHIYLHVCDNITLYKSWLFKLKSEDVSTKYQYSYTKSNFEPSSTKLRLNNLITCFIHLRLRVKDTHYRKLFLFMFILTFGIKYRLYTNGIHIKLSYIHEHKLNIMQLQSYVFITHYSVCLISYIYTPCYCRLLITLWVTYLIKFTSNYMNMYGFLLNLFQFICDICMKPDYRCNQCYAGDTYLKSPNDTNAHYYLHSDNLKMTNPFTTIDYFNVPDTHSISMPAILMDSPDLPFQNIANDCFLTELTGVNSSRNDSTLDLINDHGHIDYSALGNIDPDTNFLTDINLSLCDYYTEFEYNQCFQKNNQFSILNLNVRSLPKNIDAVKHFLAGLHTRFSILSFTETWLCEYNVSTHNF